MHVFPNGKMYIGKTGVSLDSRWKNGGGYSAQEKISAAIKKYGWENVKHYILFEDVNAEDARALEVTAIQEFKTDIPKFGYNNVAGRYAVGSVSDGTLSSRQYNPIPVNGRGKII